MKPYKIIAIVGLCIGIICALIKRDGTYFIAILMPAYALSMVIELIGSNGEQVPSELRLISRLRGPGSARFLGWSWAFILLFGWFVFMAENFYWN